MITKVAQKLVFAITEAPALGYLFEPYLVDLTPNGELSLSFRRITEHTLSDYIAEPSDVVLRIIRIIDEYSDEELVKRFSKKNITPFTFFRELEKEKTEKLIRPFIDKRLTQCLSLFREHDIKLHFQGRKKDGIRETPIDIMDNPANVIFNFDKDDNELKYHISIKHQGNDIKLTHRDAFLLTHKPCWLFLNNKLFWFEGEIDSKKIEPFLSKPHIIVNKSHEKTYFDKFVKNAIAHYKVNARGFSIDEVTKEGKCVLRFNNNWFGEPVLIMQFSYGKAVFLANDSSVAKVEMTQTNGTYLFEKIYRDKTLERKKAAFVQNLGLKHKEGAVFSLPEDPKEKNLDYYTDKKTELLAWINKHEKELRNNQIFIAQENHQEKYYMGTIKLSMNVEQHADWFDLYGKVQFGDISVPFVSLRDHIINGIREFKLPNGEVAVIPDEWFSKYAKILRFAKTEKDNFRLKKHYFKLVKTIDKNQAPSKEINILDQLTSNKDLIKTSLPETTNVTLRPYQIEGYNWINFLRTNNLNGCLADDMGLGKTLQALLVLLRLKEENKNLPEKQKTKKASVQATLFDFPIIQKKHTHLIVMPLSLIHNWENEIKKFTPQLSFYEHAGIKRVTSTDIFSEFDIILTTYGVVRNDKEILKNFNFTYIILDESQVIKNPGSKIYKAIKEIPAQHKLTLTGTPIENSLNDLWSQMSFLNDDMLGTLKFFKNYFVKPIEKNKNEERQEELRQIISPFILRRTKNNVAKDLPPLSTKVYYCEMTDDQNKIYEKKKSAIRNYILENIEKQGKEKSHFIILNGLMQLRMLANHPLLVSEDYKKESGKFEEIIRSVRKLVIEKHKILLFSSFVKHLNLIKNYLDEHNYTYSMLTGEDSDKKRQEAINHFQHDEGNRIFLISLKAGGVGLNLTSADYVFILDPWWNPAVENQAINRSHRIGQNKKVFAYKFICRNSIEEKILKLQEEKNTLANDFVNQNNPFKNFSEEDIKNLFD